ncbi:MAG TPA: Calx-beta domain-containing protein, partial [Pyrinomonadaceae bacterium]|nr:Calx-beta domain-containing protein [Pyrinomonadaceae bacterium]
NDPTPVPCDGGTTLVQSNGMTLTSNVLFYAPMALGPGSPNTVYFGADRLYRSNDRGDTMTAVSQIPLASPVSPISTIAIWKGGDNVRIAGTMNGQLWATSTGSSTMVNITPTAPALPANPAGGTNKFIGRAMIDPNNKNIAYVTLSYYAPAGQGVWKITNLNAAAAASPVAATWQASGNGIPSVPINAFAIDPLNSNNLYAGTDIGVYFSSDAGATWSPFGTSLPKVSVFDLQIQPTSRILRAGTHGRGIWETALANPAASTIQFLTSSTSITEGTGGNSVDAVVTVTRGGDPSFPATVNYATSDASGANGCGIINGSASARCDYIATSGTLNFAANETTKTISIPITYDSYAEGAETFTVTLSSPTGLNANLGAPSTSTITINDSGFTGPNQIDNSQFYVRQHYVDFLNREPDASGLAFWTNQMTNCSSPPPADLTVCKVNVSGAFFLSIEFQQTGYLVERIYKTAFGDANGTAGGQPIKVPIIRLNQFLPDTQRIGQGVVVGVGNWQQQLDDNKNAFTEEFVQRPAFLAALPLSMTTATFVDTLNGNAKDANGTMPLSTAERDNLVAALNNGTMTRAQVLRAVAEDPDLNNSEKNRAFVLMQYFGYLRRNPNDPQDSDYSGYSFWLNKLNAANGDYIAAEMVKAFITASEYRGRFGTN